MTIEIILTGDRASGKTVLAWSLLRFIEAMGHNVEYIATTHELQRMIESENFFPEQFEKRNVRIREIP